MSDYKDAWDNYWQSGLYTSCVSEGVDAYPPAVQNFWDSNVFELIENQDSIVDLCSGGGGIPKLIIDKYQGTDTELEIKITDLAQIEKQIESEGNIKLSYYANCNCEGLPFKDQEFNLVTSSYGIEYSNLEVTVKEIHRVLDKGGVFAAVMHCQGSEIVKNSNKQLVQVDNIINKYNFFKLFKNMYLAKSKSTVLQKSSEKKLLLCLDNIKTELLHDNTLHIYRMVLNAAHDIFVFGQVNKPIKCIEYINRTQKALTYNYQRMVNLSNVEISNNEIEILITKIKKLGFNIIENKNIISAQNKILGYGLICKK
jgi:ubiquinone/menaquinone biosynthesis C-methylase UbiE